MHFLPKTSITYTEVFVFYLKIAGSLKLFVSMIRGLRSSLFKSVTTYFLYVYSILIEWISKIGRNPTHAEEKCNNLMHQYGRHHEQRKNSENKGRISHCSKLLRFNIFLTYKLFRNKRFQGYIQADKRFYSDLPISMRIFSRIVNVAN